MSLVDDGVVGLTLDQCFRKSERLVRRADYVRVQTTGTKFRTKRVAISSVPRSSGASRLGITVSRKVGNSPIRSQVKRWIREVFRLHKSAWPDGIDFVVIARAPAAQAGYHRLEADMLRWAKEFKRPKAEGATQ